MNYWKSINRTLFMLVCLLAMAGVAAADIQLPEGTAVEVAFDQDVSSKYLKPGELVPIRLLKPIEFGGLVVVNEGAKGSARVKSVEPAGRGGKPGEVTLELLDLEPGSSYKAADDKKIMLRSAQGDISAKGKGKQTLSYLLIFGLFIKGGQGEIPADTPIKAEIAQDIMIIIE